MRYYLVKTDDILIPADKLDAFAELFDTAIAVSRNYSDSEYKIAARTTDKVSLTPFSPANLAKIILEQQEG